MLSRRILPSRYMKRTALRYFSGSQKEFLVLNAVGPDRPGIVSDLTKLVVDQGGNVGGSQAQKLGSHFGLMMLVSVPKNHSMKLQELVNGISDMTTSCYITNDPNATEITPTVGYSGEFTLRGADHPGIVHRVTNILAKYRLSIDEMTTFEEEAPHGGTTLFNLHGKATAPSPLPKGFNASLIREELHDLGDQMNCDIDLADDIEELANISVA